MCNNIPEAYGLVKHVVQKEGVESFLRELIERIHR